MTKKYVHLTTLTPEQNVQVAYRSIVLGEKQDVISHTIWNEKRKAYAWVNLGRVSEAVVAARIAAFNPVGLRQFEKVLSVKRGRGRPSTAIDLPAPPKLKMVGG